MGKGSGSRNRGEGEGEGEDETMADRGLQHVQLKGQLGAWAIPYFKSKLETRKKRTRG